MRLKLREEAGFSETTEVVGLHRCAIRFVLRDEDSNSLKPH